MRTVRTLLIVIGLFALGGPAPRALAAQSAGPPASPFHHGLDVRIDPATHRVTVTDEVTLPAAAAGGAPAFVLNGQLAITRSSPEVEEIPAAGGPGGPLSHDPRLALKHYRVKAGTGGTALTITYEGAVDVPLSDPKEEYTRGFRETPGLIGPEGVYLAGSSFWYPRFGEELVTFTMQAAVPRGWHLISQGNGTSRDDQGQARWDSVGPMDEIDLVGGPLHVFRDSAGAVETLVYLHQADAALAGKYLAATAQYIEMYRGLIGPYPYGKFALVENFWETGYGMPTFTLLGPQIIRFPFIINSSYPHEILHNWWGNSVFVDSDTGNWCEGLTAYLADHLIAEQRGTGDEYRRATLQKYRDYVKAGRDFPLAEFRARSSAAEEAVGYGKALMGDHMLRLAIGDEAFRKFVARFYRDFRGRRASFRDLQRTAEAVTGTPLGWLFDDLITRAGAPVLDVAMDAPAVRPSAGEFTVHGTLLQTQPGRPFTVDVPIVVQTAQGTVSHVVRLASARQAFVIRVTGLPLALHVDPRFDVFRRLDPRETPPSIGQIFGEPSITALLPSNAPAAEIAAYRELLQGWQSDSHAIDVKLDSEVQAPPRDRPVWLLGRTNRFAAAMFGTLPGVVLGTNGVELDGEKMPFAAHTLVVTARHPASVEKAVGWIVADPASAMPGLGRKLPHYGKYSYLGFEGDEPVNTIKGQWQQSDSPLRVDLREAAARGARIPALPPDTRKALAELPPVFSQKALGDHVAYLASPGLRGRGLGSAGLQAAATYIASAFKAAGLAPGGDRGTYLQTFGVPRGEDGQPHDVANVVGVLPGTKPEWKNQSVIVSAHFDHLGLGWPDVHKGDEGRIHPGADDNASGVAVLLELARAIGAGEQPLRTILFVAFTGEEAGRLGSEYYAAHPLLPLDQVMGVINLDTVGRLGTQKLSVLGTGSATEWQHIFRGAGFVTGVDSRNIPESVEASDQVSFTERGVPAVQIFTAATSDYHRPTDTADKIDLAGLVKVAAFTKEGIVYLAERPEPLTGTIAPPAATGARPAPPTAGAPGQPPARRVSFGTVPDFAFPGPGVRVSDVVPDSPAAKAGLKAGDTLVSVGGVPIANLQGFSDILRTLTPGQTVEVVLQREGQEVRRQVTLAER